MRAGTPARRELGYFTRVAQIVGGGWLGWWMVSAAAISQIGQFEVRPCGRAPAGRPV